MKRYRTSIYTLLAVAYLSITVPRVASAAGTSIFAPIVPQSGSCLCAGSAPDWGCVLQVVQNVINTAIGLGILLCVVYIAYAGFTLMTSGGSPGAREQGKQRITNAVVGIAVILCSWLVVDFVMKALYNPETVFQADIFGPWNSIWASTGDDFCIKAHDPVALTTGSLGILLGESSPGQSSATFTPGTGTGACNPTQVIAAAAANNVAITAAQANTLACIAHPESGCGAKTTGATTVSGAPTSASGPWQITIGASDKCHSLTLPACGNLNCSAAYSKGRVKSDAASQAIAKQCQAAVNDLKCSTAAAMCLVNASGGKFSAWTADSRSSQQKQCITSNGGSY